MAVVVRVGDPAVDLGGGEDQAAPLAERNDLVHGHGEATAEQATYRRVVAPRGKTRPDFPALHVKTM